MAAESWERTGHALLDMLMPSNELVVMASCIMFIPRAVVLVHSVCTSWRTIVIDNVSLLGELGILEMGGGECASH